MNPEKGTEIAACWKEFHPEVRSILTKATAKNMPRKIYRKTSRKITKKKNQIGMPCVFMPCVFQGKIIADENHLGKGEALD